MRFGDCTSLIVTVASCSYRGNCLSTFRRVDAHLAEADELNQN